LRAQKRGREVVPCPKVDARFRWPNQYADRFAIRWESNSTWRRLLLLHVSTLINLRSVESFLGTAECRPAEQIVAIRSRSPKCLFISIGRKKKLLYAKNIFTTN